MSIEAMKLALEALIAVEALIEHQYTGTRDGMTAFQDASDDAHLAIEPLRQAIEQAEKQEPVAVYRAGQTPGEVYHVQFLKEMISDEVLLYTSPPPHQPEQTEKQCQCPACKIKPHVSDCAVHNAPAYPAGGCDCGAEKSEPVAWIEHHKAGDNLVWDEPNKGTPLYTSPPPRQPLTDEEMWKLWNAQGDDFMEQQAAIAFARAIEAAHGIKGEA